MKILITEPGCVLDLDDEQAARLIAQGQAVCVDCGKDCHLDDRTFCERLARKGGHEGDNG